MITFSYANTSGQGNRTAGIAVTQPAGTPIATPSDLINGDFGTGVTLPNDNWAFVFDFGSQKYIRQWCVWATSSGAIVTRISGSNDNVNWTALGADETVQVDLTDVTKGNGCLHLPIFDNLQSWRYYKWERISGSATFVARDLEFYIGGVATGLPLCSQRYPGAIGNRAGIVSWSTNKSIVAGAVLNLGDGLLDAAHAVEVGNQVDTYIQWDFSTAGQTVLDIFTFKGFYNAPNFHGTWNVLGSNDNWGSSSVVQGNFGTPGFGSAFDQALSTPGFYSSYRLQNVGGTGCDPSQYMTEFEFRLAPSMNFVEAGGGVGTTSVAVVG